MWLGVELMNVVTLFILILNCKKGSYLSYNSLHIFLFFRQVLEKSYLEVLNIGAFQNWLFWTSSIGMKRRALKAKYVYSFWSSAKRRKGFSKINDTFKYELQKWIISRIHVNPSPIANDYITVKFDD